VIRAYENPDLPLSERLPSLARRFSCISRADGLDPWSPDRFHEWVVGAGEGTPAWHAGHLVLGLWGDGPWERFDAVAAVAAWGDADRRTFANWCLVWR